MIIKNKHDKSTQIYANNIINQTPNNEQETGVNYTRTTGHYIKYDAPHY